MMHFVIREGLHLLLFLVKYWEKSQTFGDKKSTERLISNSQHEMCGKTFDSSGKFLSSILPFNIVQPFSNRVFLVKPRSLFPVMGSGHKSEVGGDTH